MPTRIQQEIMVDDKLGLLRLTGKLRIWRKKKFNSMSRNISKCKWWMRIRRTICKWPTIQNWLRTLCRSIDEVSHRDTIMSRINPWSKQIWLLMRRLQKRKQSFRNRGLSLRCRWCRRTRLRRPSSPNKTLLCPSNRWEDSTKLLRRQR